MRWQGDDGVELDWESRGEGPAVVCLHGLTFNRSILVHAFDAPLAAAGWRRIYVDLPGHGASPSLSPATTDSFTWLLSDFIRDVAGPSPALLAHGYGAYLAQCLVRELAAVSGLFLVCPVVEPDLTRRELPAAVARVRDELAFSDEAEAAAFEQVAVRQTNDVLAAFRSAVHPAHQAVDRELVAEVRASYGTAHPFGAALAACPAPSTVLCGRDDHWNGWSDAAILVHFLHRTRFIVLPDVGALLPLEAAADLPALVAEWSARARLA